MVKSHIQSKKGSTLAMMILVIGILLILGIALVSATVVGYSAKQQDNRNKAAFYIAEAGLDEAYAYLGEEVENATQYSRKVYVATSLVNNPNETLIVGSDDYKNKVNGYFKDGYKNYFITNKNNILDRLKNLLNAKALVNTAHNEQIQSIDAKVDRVFDTSGNSMVITFETVIQRLDEHKQAKGSSQKITTTLEIEIPNYDTPYVQEQKNYTVSRNALMDKAMAVDENIYVSGGNVRVNGNVFAHGADEASPSTIAGGISIGCKDALGNWGSGNLTVNGNVDTNRYIQIQYSKDDSKSNLSVTGEAACNSMSINGNYSDGSIDPKLNSSASISIGGDASVLDDTELNATKSKISITGNYYGFSSGNKTHDQSSSLIINSDDIDTDSTLTVAGGGASRTFFDPSIKIPDPQTITVPSGVYLAGTAYVDSGATYQTGDSVAVIANYITYSEGLILPEAQYKPGDFDRYSGIDPASLEYGDYYTELGNLNLVSFWKDQLNGKQPMIASDKINYDYYGFLQDSSRLKLGGPSRNIKVSNVQYSFGNYIDAFSGTKAVMKQPVGDVAASTKILAYVEKMFKYKVNLMSDSQRESNYVTASDLDTYPGVKGWLKDSWTQTSQITTNGGTKPTESHVVNQAGAGEAIIVVGSGDVAATLTALLAKLKADDLNYHIVNASANSAVNGIILAKQDVYFLGQLNYTGLVVSEKSIYCMGSGEKTFTNLGTDATTNYVINKIIEDLEMYHTAGGIGTWFKQDASWTKKVTKTVSVSDVYKDSKDLGYAGSLQNAVRITSWKRTP